MNFIHLRALRGTSLLTSSTPCAMPPITQSCPLGTVVGALATCILGPGKLPALVWSRIVIAVRPWAPGSRVVVTPVPRSLGAFFTTRGMSSSPLRDEAVEALIDDGSIWR